MTAGAYLKVGSNLASRTDAGYHRYSRERGLLLRFAQASSVDVRSRQGRCKRLAMSTQLLMLGLERFRANREAIDTSTYKGSMGSERRSRFQAGGGMWDLTERTGKECAPNSFQQCGYDRRRPSVVF